MRTEYPECDRLADIAPTTQHIMEFLSWLHEEKKISLTNHHLLAGHVYISSHEVIQHMETYFKIDMQLVEDERRQMIAELSK